MSIILELYIQVFCKKDWPSVITCNVNLLVTPHGYTHICIIMTFTHHKCTAV